MNTAVVPTDGGRTGRGLVARPSLPPFSIDIIIAYFFLPQQWRRRCGISVTVREIHIHTHRHTTCYVLMLRLRYALSSRGHIIVASIVDPHERRGYRARQLPLWPPGFLIASEEKRFYPEEKHTPWELYYFATPRSFFFKRKHIVADRIDRLSLNIVIVPESSFFTNVCLGERRSAPRAILWFLSFNRSLLKVNCRIVASSLIDFNRSYVSIFLVWTHTEEWTDRAKKACCKSSRFPTNNMQLSARCASSGAD